MTGKETAGVISPATARIKTAHSVKEIKMMAKAAGEFAAGQLTPDREKNDRYPFGPFFSHVVQKAFDLDFFHLLLAEELNGMQMGVSALAVVLENICRADSSLGGIILTTVAAQQLMQHAGSTDPLKTICASESAYDFLIALPVFNNPSEVKHLAEVRTAGGRFLLSGQMEHMVLGAGQACPGAGSANRHRRLFLFSGGPGTCRYLQKRFRIESRTARLPGRGPGIGSGGRHAGRPGGRRGVLF